MGKNLTIDGHYLSVDYAVKSLKILSKKLKQTMRKAAVVYKEKALKIILKEKEMKHKDKELQYQEWRDTKEESPKIKTNIKMRVNPEQSKKVQEICFKNGIFWRIRKEVRYLNEPFLFIDDSISFMYSVEEEDFLKDGDEEVDADFLSELTELV